MITDSDKSPTENYIDIPCRLCGTTASYSEDVIVNEIDRLRINNFQILMCKLCRHAFDIHDFTNALNAHALKNKELFIKEEPNKLLTHLTNIDVSEFDKPDYRFKTHDEILQENERQALKIEQYKQEQIKLMQSGKSYDKSVVGDVPMEEGTPGDRRCVRVLKTEADLYAYTAMCIVFTGSLIYAFYKIVTNFINKLIKYVTHLITKLIEYVIYLITKLNWCIICSVGRICSFIGSILFIPYALYCSYTEVAVFGFNTMFHNNVWNVGSLIVVLGGLYIQIVWIIGSDGKWAKFIHKHVLNKFGKEGQ